MTRIIKISGLAFFFIFQIFLFLIKKYDCLDLDIYPNAKPTYYICGQHTIGQTFISHYSNLSRVDIMLGNYDRQSEAKIYFFLWEVKGKRKIWKRQVEFLTSEVKNNLYHEIKFEPIRDSKGKVYYFALSSPESTPETAISAWMNDKNIYRHGNYIFDGQEKRGDLVFRTYSRHNLISSLSRILRRHSGILASKSIFYSVIIIFECLSFLMFYLLIRFFCPS